MVVSQPRYAGRPMEYSPDLRQPVPPPSAMATPAYGIDGGRAADDEATPLAAGTYSYSFWADCECPDDCSRDHSNE